MIYSLAKWARLALAGNPTILTLLFVPDAFVVTTSLYGDALRALAPAFVGNTEEDY